MSEFALGIWAAITAFLVLFIISMSKPVNISEAELLRFCMQKSIPLEQCKIHKENPVKSLRGE